jgi:hypothetical protein
MAKISTYENDGSPSLADKVIGTEASSDNATKNYLLSDIKSLMFQNFGVTQVLNGVSTVNQLPSGLDTALQVSFGAAQYTASDPVMIDSAGTVTFNQPGLYLLNAYSNVERQGSSGGVSVLLFRYLINDVQAGSVKGFEFDSTGVMFPYELTIPLNIAVAGTTLKFQIMRDSSGVDQGGLYIHNNLGGWSNVPSAEIGLWRIGN